MAATGCVRELTGHASARLPDREEMLVRCRRRDDPGVEFTETADIKRVAFDGTSGELDDGYRLQSEFAIHAEIYRARPDVGAIVHAHPKHSVLCGLLGLALEPIVGAYDPEMLELAAAGIPVYPRGRLINSAALGRELAETLGDKNVCLLRGHGTVAVGGTVAEATMRAVKLEALAELTVLAASTGRTAPSIDRDDRAALLDGWETGRATYMEWTWQFYRRKLVGGVGCG